MTPKIIRISPSIIATDYKNEEELTRNLQLIEKSGASMLHLDVMDGKFVKNKTFDYRFVDKIKDKTNLLLDVHLMIENPESKIEKYVNAGADIISVHYEACKNPIETLKFIKSQNVVSGLAINPKTSPLKIKEIIDSGYADIILVMSVEPGEYGQQFIPGSAEKVAEIREMSKKVFIEIDGGVTVRNSAILRRLGVNIIVSGATIFKSKNIKKTIRQLKGKCLFNL